MNSRKQREEKEDTDQLDIKDANDVQWTNERIHALEKIFRAPSYSLNNYFSACREIITKETQKHLREWGTFCKWHRVASREMLSYLLQGHPIMLPETIGVIGCVRYRRSLGDMMPYYKKRIDWIETKKTGKMVYREEPAGKMFYLRIHSEIGIKHSMYRMLLKSPHGIKMMFGLQQEAMVKDEVYNLYPDISDYKIEEINDLLMPPSNRLLRSRTGWMSFLSEYPWVMKAADAIDAPYKTSAEWVYVIVKHFSEYIHNQREKPHLPLSYPFFCFNIKPSRLRMFRQRKKLKKLFEDATEVKYDSVPHYCPLMKKASLFPHPLNAIRAVYNRFSMYAQHYNKDVEDMLKVYEVDEEIIKKLKKHKHKLLDIKTFTEFMAKDENKIAMAKALFKYRYDLDVPQVLLTYTLTKFRRRKPL